MIGEKLVLMIDDWWPVHYLVIIYIYNNHDVADMIAHMGCTPILSTLPSDIFLINSLISTNHYNERFCTILIEPHLLWQEVISCLLPYTDKDECVYAVIDGSAP